MMKLPASRNLLYTKGCEPIGVSSSWYGHSCDQFMFSKSPHLSAGTPANRSSRLRKKVRWLSLSPPKRRLRSSSLIRGTLLLGIWVFLQAGPPWYVKGVEPIGLSTISGNLLGNFSLLESFPLNEKVICKQKTLHKRIARTNHEILLRKEVSLDRFRLK